MRQLPILFYAMPLIFAAVPAAATTYIVRPDGTGDFPTIQTAIDAAIDGDIIELTDGTLYAAQRPTMCYSISKDRGQTWSV